MQSEPIKFLYKGHHYSYVLNDDLCSVIQIFNHREKTVYELSLETLVNCQITTQPFLIYDVLEKQIFFKDLPCRFQVYENAAGFKEPYLQITLKEVETFSEPLDLEAFFIDLLTYYQDKPFVLNTQLPSLEKATQKILTFLNKNAQHMFILGYQIAGQNDLPINLLFDNEQHCLGICRFNTHLTTPTLTAYTPIKLDQFSEQIQCVTPFGLFVLQNIKRLQQLAGTKFFQYSYECVKFMRSTIQLKPDYDNLAICIDKYNQLYPFKTEQYTKENVLYPFRKRKGGMYDK